LSVNIDCESNDKLLLFNEDRSFLLYDYCAQKDSFNTGRNIIVSHAKYMIIRLQTFTPNLLSTTFDLFLFEQPNLEQPINIQYHENNNLDQVVPTSPSLPPPPPPQPSHMPMQNNIMMTPVQPILPSTTTPSSTLSQSTSDYFRLANSGIKTILF
jgi:hypothetical protein